MNHFLQKNKLKLGVLGGGQLGKMLIQAAIDFDLHVKVLDPNPEAPCRGTAHEFHVGSLQDEASVLSFGEDCDILTIEIEHVNAQALEKLQQMGKWVYPDPKILGMVQDKRQQKAFYAKNQLPTAAFWLVDDSDQLLNFQHKLPLVYKSAYAGYDGKGVKVLPNDFKFDAPLSFPGLVEKKVEIDKELAVIIARNPSGETVAYPPVEMVFHPEGNLVEYLISPPDVEEAIETKANSLAFQLVEKLNFVGLLAVEMFLTKKGEVLINEIAPRPHNSGHHTIRANLTSQFEQHLRAILDLPLGKTELLVQGAMVNILGHPEKSGSPTYKGLEKILKIPGVYIHLYGKAQSRPYRKMGHITILDKERQTLVEKIHLVKNAFQVEVENGR
ncbi:MAG: 5-(carboxyamino)imidazole ribonucleotide synthase [Bacteroidota bacterium]